MKRRSFKLISAAAIVFMAMFVPARAALAGSYTYTTIDDPNAPNSGGYGTLAYGINDNGDIVGTYYDGIGGQYGFLYSGGTYTTMEDPNGVYTTFYGINDNGDIVGFYQDSNDNPHGFLYSGGTYTTIDDPNGVFTVCFGINDSGDIVGDYQDSSGNVHGFLYSGGAYTTIDDPNGNRSTCFGINDSGDIAGDYTDSSGNEHGFLYSGGAFTTLDDPNGVGKTVIAGINDSGDIAGVYEDSSGNPNSFLYSGGTYTTIEDPNGVGTTIAFGINDDNAIVGVYSADGLQGTAQGFLATPSGGGLWQNATSEGGGWYYLSPFGFFNISGSLWIFHSTLGWLYPVGTSTDSIWFYDPQWDGQGGWWWTSISVFPWVYSVTERAWLMYDTSITNARWFYNSSTGQWGVH